MPCKTLTYQLFLILWRVEVSPGCKQRGTPAQARFKRLVWASRELASAAGRKKWRARGGHGRDERFFHIGHVAESQRYARQRRSYVAGRVRARERGVARVSCWTREASEDHMMLASLWGRRPCGPEGAFAINAQSESRVHTPVSDAQTPCKAIAIQVSFKHARRLLLDFTLLGC